MLRLECHDVVFEIQCADPHVLDMLPGYLPPGHRPSAAEPRARFRVEPRRDEMHQVYRGDEPLGRPVDRVGACEILEGQVNILVAEHARGLIFVHAGVVAWRGRGIILPGRSMAGKSTLVSALVRAGATYYSDEYAPLDERGYVHAHPRPISLRQAKGWPLRVAAGEGGDPLPVGLVVLSAYRPGATWRPREMGPGRAMLHLLDNTVPALSRPRESLRCLKHAVGPARCVRSVRGDADEIAPELLEMLA